MQESEAGDEEFAVAVDADLAGGRLDAVLAKALPAFSRNRIKDLILAGAAAINGQTALEPKTKVKDGDALLITAQPPEDPGAGPEDIVTPGHVFPLVARDGGVLVRAGHTEAAVDLARLAGLYPSGVICEIMNDDGSMARMPDLVKFAQFHGIKIGTISDLIAYRRKYDHLINRAVETTFESHNGGTWKMMVFVNTIDYAEHIALVKGDVVGPDPVLVRMHAINIFSDMLRYKPYEKDVLGESMRIIAEEGRGVVVILRQTRPTFVTDTLLRRMPEDIDRRRIKEYGVGAQILLDLGVQNMILLTDSPEKKAVALDGYGLNIVGTHPIRGQKDGA